MDPEHVITVGDYHRFVGWLGRTVAPNYTGPLEQYLRSVLSAATIHHSEPPTFRLLARILTIAFSRPPVPFDPAWLAYTDPPAVVFAFDGDPATDASFSALQHMLYYQIADLHRLQDDGILDDPLRYGGLKSSSGNYWYNFDPQSFLECAAASGRIDAPETECDWDALIITLWLGQIYE